MSEPMDMDFLLRAAESNELITVYHKTETGKTLVYGSRFYQINPKKKYIIIAHPYGEDGTYQQLVRKDKITLFFIEKGFRFLLHSEVLKRDKMKLHGESETPVMIIKMPKDIYDGERRNFFRVTAPADPPVSIKYISYFESGHSFEDQQDSPELSDVAMSQAIVHDLSSGGLAIRSRGETGLMVGDIINMKFTFKPDEPDMRIEGLINNSRLLSDKETILKGIEFIPDRSDDYRDAIKKISRYVMEQQRRMIKSYGRNFY